MNARPWHVFLSLSAWLLAGALTGCLGSEQPAPPDSETHFLRMCLSNAACGEGLECICGVCSAACDPASDCSGQHPEASCVSVDAFADGADCAEANGPVSVCELECTADGDCADLSSGHTCQAGRCRAPDTGVETCSYDGRTYAVGETFPDSDGCNNCSCGEGGQVACTSRACVPNEPGVCEYEGSLYRPGETWAAPGGCGACICNADLSVDCTQPPCPLPNPPCSYNGRSYEVGETFLDADGCNMCTCQPGNQVACDDRDCSGECEYNGTTYNAGDSFPSADGCNTCSCSAGGLVACTLRACVPNTDPDRLKCEAAFDPGECDAAMPVYWHNPDTGLCELQTYGGCGGNDNRYDTEDACMTACGARAAVACKVDGTVYPHGSPVPDPFSCNQCTCNDGAIDGCTEIACDMPCPPNRVPGISCAQCGPADGCEVRETGCLPVCGAADECTSDPAYFWCETTAGHCMNVCG